MAQSVIVEHGAQLWDRTWTVPWTVGKCSQQRKCPVCFGTFKVHSIIFSNIIVMELLSPIGHGHPLSISKLDLMSNQTPPVMIAVMSTSVPVDKYHGKCNHAVGERCAQYGMKKSFDVDFSTCSRLVSKQLCDEWVRKMHVIRNAWKQNPVFGRTTNCLLGWEENPSITSMYQHATAHVKHRIVQLMHLLPYS
jgi:hypothetical protein